jgi:hypothetical protein
MLALQGMAAQQERLGSAGLARLQPQRALFGQLVEARVKLACLGHEQPPEPLQGDFQIHARAHLLLAFANSTSMRPSPA